MSGEVAVDCYDSLDDQVALVTGATRGIGAAIASELTDLGATVYAGARDVADITAPEQRAVRLDVTVESEIDAAIERVDEEAGRLDIVVNNAGVFYRSGPLHEMSTDEFDHTLDVNLRGPTLVTKHALPLLLEQEGARVVSLSSNLGQFSTGQMGGEYPPYRVSKVGLGGLTAYLHAEYGDEGLIANAVSPGGSEPTWVAQTRIGVLQKAQTPPCGSRDSHPAAPVGVCGETVR